MKYFKQIQTTITAGHIPTSFHMSEGQLIIFFVIAVPVTFVAPLAYYFGIWIAPLLLYIYEGLIIALKIKLAFNESMKQLSIQQANQICLVFCLPPIILFCMLASKNTQFPQSNNDLLIRIGIDSELKQIISLLMYSLFLGMNLCFRLLLRGILDQERNIYTRIRATDTQSFKQQQLDLKQQLLLSQIESLLELITKKNKNAKITIENKNPESSKDSTESLPAALPMEQQKQQLIIISNQIKEVLNLKCEANQMQELSRLQLIINEFEIHLKNKQHSGHVLMSRAVSKGLDKGKQCAICLEDFLGAHGELDKRIYTLDCSHSYHSFCILKSIQAISRNCPYCRKAILSKLSIEGI